MFSRCSFKTYLQNGSARYLSLKTISFEYQFASSSHSCTIAWCVTCVPNPRQAPPPAATVTRQDQLQQKAEKAEKAKGAEDGKAAARGRGRGGRGKGRGKGRGRGRTPKVTDDNDEEKDDPNEETNNEGKQDNKRKHEEHPKKKAKAKATKTVKEEPWAAWGTDEAWAMGWWDDEWDAKGWAWDSYAYYENQNSLYELKEGQDTSANTTEKTEQTARKKKHTQEPKQEKPAKRKEEKKDAEPKKKAKGTASTPAAPSHPSLIRQPVPETREERLQEITGFMDGFKTMEEDKARLLRRGRLQDVASIRLNVYHNRPAVGLHDRIEKRDIAYFRSPGAKCPDVFHLAALLKAAEMMAARKHLYIFLLVNCGVRTWYIGIFGESANMNQPRCLIELLAL